MVHFFCPNCWKEISEEELLCPFCNYNLSEFMKLDYEKKLIIALNHPIKEIRRTIVFIIGEKKLKEAVNELEKLINEEDDPIILIEIAKALVKINCEQSKKILQKMRSHRFPIISHYSQGIQLSQN